MVTKRLMSSRMAMAASRAAWAKSRPSPPVFCHAHMMPREELTMAPWPYLSKAYCTSSAVPLGAVAGHQEEGVLRRLRRARMSEGRWPR